MAGRNDNSFLKRQKEQQRVARANAKRAERQARRENRAAQRAAGAPAEDWDTPEGGAPAPAQDDPPAE